MGIQDYVDIYYIGDNQVKVGRFSASRIGNTIKVGNLSVYFDNEKRSREVFEGIKSKLQNLDLNSSVVLYEDKYTIIALPLSAVWEYKWVYTTEDNLFFPFKILAKQFFEALKKKLHSIKVSDWLSQTSPKAYRETEKAEGLTLGAGKRIVVNADAGEERYFPVLNANLIEVFEKLPAQTLEIPIDIKLLPVEHSQYIQETTEGYEEVNVKIYDTEEVEGKQNLYKTEIDITEFEDVSVISVRL